MTYHIHYIPYSNSYTVYTTIGFQPTARLITLDTNLTIDEVHQLLS